MKSNFLPSKILILLGAACLVWIGILSFVILGLAGFGWSLGWLVPVVLGISFLGWFAVMAGEFRAATGSAPNPAAVAVEAVDLVTSPLPGAVSRGRGNGFAWRAGRAAMFRRVGRPTFRRRSLARGLARGEWDSSPS